LPPGYGGQFGPGLKSLSYALYYAGGMSEGRILELLGQAGIELCGGTLSNWLCLGQGQTPLLSLFGQEAQAVYQAGLASSPWQHPDTTMTRVSGSNYNCHVLTNPLYTSYCPLPQRDRLSEYVRDRLSGLRKIADLGGLISQKAATLELGKSWEGGVAQTQLASARISVVVTLAKFLSGLPPLFELIPKNIFSLTEAKFIGLT
jgi:hypothetical protein